jgi:hypothetical protein
VALAVRLAYLINSLNFFTYSYTIFAMANRLGNTPDADEPIASNSQDGVQPQLTLHQSVGYSGMPMHMYPFSSGMISNPQQIRSKRRQVKNACTNCQKACKKCDDARPCLRCVKYGIAEECIDSQRKERKKGVKRGPYKKRDVKDPDRADKSPEAESSQTPQAITIPAAATSASPPMGPFMAPVAYPPGLYGQYTQPTGRSGEAAAYYHQLFVQLPQNTDSDGPAYPPHAQFYPTFVPYGGPYSSYMVPHQRPDGQITFAPYPIYQKPPSAGGSNDSGTSSGQRRMDSRTAREQEEEEEEEAGDH